MAVSKRLISTVKKTILTSATIHLVLIVVYALQTSNVKILSPFHFLQLDLFIPTVILGLSSDLLASIGLTAMFGLFFFFS